MITFAVRGIPAPQGSKRAIINRYTHRVALIESSERVKPWRADIRAAAEEAMGARSAIEGPVTLSLSFLMPRPKGHFGTGKNAGRLRDQAPAWPVGKPDLDKLVRAVLDGLKGIVYVDDSQVVQMFAAMRYVGSTDRGGPGLVVSID